MGVLDQSHMGPVVARLRILINGPALSSDTSQDTCRSEGLRLSIILASGRGEGREGDPCWRLPRQPSPANPPHCPLTCLIMCLTTTARSPEQRGPSGGKTRMIAPSVPAAPGGGGGRRGSARVHRPGGRGGHAERRCLGSQNPGGRCRCQDLPG